jgi:hypothetical protein
LFIILKKEGKTMKSKLTIDSPVLLGKALSYTRQEGGITIFVHLPTGNAEQDSYS